MGGWDLREPKKYLGIYTKANMSKQQQGETSSTHSTQSSTQSTQSTQSTRSGSTHGRTTGSRPNTLSSSRSGASRMTGGGKKTNANCWEGGQAVVDEFRTAYRRRAEDMDAFGLALHNILQYINGPLRESVKKVNNGTMPDDLEDECFACLPVEYAKGIASQDTGTRTSTADALVLEMLNKQVFPKLPYEETCEIKPIIPALGTNTF
tara:strand:- start:65 stop:685 length:621 start_codon:yes stop_codon:yes gene_type:complete